MSDRGMKKWAPFSSLIEQATCLEQMRYERNKIDKPLISQDKAEEINLALTNYQGGPIKIKFYHGGYIYEIVAAIKSIDIINKILILDEGKLRLNDILDIESNNVL